MFPSSPSDPTVLVPLAAFGLVFGSFVTALSYRLPRGESIAHGRSRCPACGHTLTAADLVPVFSWIAHRGSCRHCGAKISWRYPAIELATAGLFVAAGVLAADFLHLALLAAMTPVMVALAVIDLEHRRLPNIFLAILAALALAWRWSGDRALLTGLETAAVVLVAGMLLDALSRFVSGRPGLGMGDTKLMALAGLALPLGPFLLFLSAGSVLGLIWGVIWRAKQRATPQGFPFAPALLIAYWLSLAAGERGFQRLVIILSG